MAMMIDDLTIEVQKKDIKNLHLYVKPPDGAVTISAPKSMGDKAIELFARTKLSWIRRQREKFQSAPRLAKREYVSGETLYLWGKQYFLSVEHTKGMQSIKLTGNRAILTVREGHPASHREAFVNEWYRKELRSEIERLLPKMERISGIRCNEFRIKNMTTRWGTCNTKIGRIWLNLQLAKYDTACLEYVILHELVHLKERDHGSRFTAMLDELMPYWRDIRARLNQQPLRNMIGGRGSKEND